MIFFVLINVFLDNGTLNSSIPVPFFVLIERKKKITNYSFLQWVTQKFYDIFILLIFKFKRSKKIWVFSQKIQHEKVYQKCIKKNWLTDIIEFLKANTGNKWTMLFPTITSRSKRSRRHFKSSVQICMCKVLLHFVPYICLYTISVHIIIYGACFERKARIF